MFLDITKDYVKAWRNRLLFENSSSEWIGYVTALWTDKKTSLMIVFAIILISVLIILSYGKYKIVGIAVSVF